MTGDGARRERVVRGTSEEGHRTSKRFVPKRQRDALG